MAADLQAVIIVAQVIGVMDGPACQPEHLALEGGERRELFSGYFGRLLHRLIMSPGRWRWMPIPVIKMISISSFNHFFEKNR